MARSVEVQLRQNRLVSSLATADRKLVSPLLESVELELEKVLITPNLPIRHIYFPTSGIVSVVTSSSRKRQIEVGIIGREGMAGVNVLLGENQSPHATYVQIAGQGLRADVRDLRKVLDRSTSLRNKLLRFAHAWMVQKAYTALAVSQGTIEERLARWLLMAHDRLDNAEILVTHARLADVLSFQRTGVTAALNRLERRNIIDLRRGAVAVRNRVRWKAVAKDLYGTPEAEYRRIFGRH